MTAKVDRWTPPASSATRSDSTTEYLTKSKDLAKLSP